MSKLVVLTPVREACDRETEQCLGELHQRGYEVRVVAGCSLVDFGRSTMLTRAMEDGFDEFLWIDGDVVFLPDDVEKLRSHNLPIVAGLYVKKDCSGFAAKFRHEADAQTFGKGGGLVEMTCVGMGFTLVRLEALDAIVNQTGLKGCQGDGANGPFLPFHMPLVAETDRGPVYLGEDYAFCWRARQAGLQIWADTTIKLGHLARRPLTWDDLAKSEAKPEPEAHAQQALPAPEPCGPPESDLYQTIGRQAVAIQGAQAAQERLLGEYRKLLRLIATCKAGEVSIEEVQINEENQSWAVLALPEAAKQAIRAVRLRQDPETASPTCKLYEPGPEAQPQSQIETVPCA